MSHEVHSGQTGCGKSKAALRKAVYLARSGYAVLVLDPHSTLGDEFYPHLVKLGFDDKTYVDDLNEVVDMEAIRDTLDRECQRLVFAACDAKAEL